MLAPPSVRSQSDPLPTGVVTQVLVGAPVPVQTCVGPSCMQGVPEPAMDRCGLEVLDAGGVPPEAAPLKSWTPADWVFEAVVSRPCDGPPTVRQIWNWLTPAACGHTTLTNCGKPKLAAVVVTVVVVPLEVTVAASLPEAIVVASLLEAIVVASLPEEIEVEEAGVDLLQWKSCK